jgi:hypothetical protein
MTPELEARFKKLEDALANHQHTGLDSLQVNFSSLYKISKIEITIDPASLANGDGSTHIVPISGVNIGDFVLVSAPYDLQDVTVTGYVQAQDVVEIRIQNESGGVRDFASGTWRLLVIKK